MYKMKRKLDFEKKLIVGILGVGEVGGSILVLVNKKHRVLIKDINQDTIADNKLDVLHVCIPYGPDFLGVVVRQIKKSQPLLTIIESTVPLKTTETIARLVATPVIHSPVRGDHKTMVTNLRRFVKFIGSDKRQTARDGKEYYRTIGVKTKILSSSRATELGKLLDTTYYALCIAWHQEMERFCKKYQINFAEGVTLFNQTYNLGYQKTKPNVIRPILTPGYIGGHCLMPNVKLLKKSVSSSFLDLIEDSNKRFQKSTRS